jgi:diacylglycerol kinase family enzyme
MYQFIVNPSAGAGKGYRVWKKLKCQLENDSQEYRVFFTEQKGDAAEIAKRLTADGDEAKLLVIVGGEGTYNEVLNGLMFKGMLTLGYIPAGFRNALSKGFQSYRNVNKQVKQILHPKYYSLLDYGVITVGEEEITSRRFAGRCGIGLDAAICHNLLSCPVREQAGRMRLERILSLFIGFKQLILAKPAKGYILLDGTKKVEFNHIYFISFVIRRNSGTKKKNAGNTDSDSGKMTVYVGNSSKKRRMIPALINVIMGVRKKERCVRVFECSEASIHLSRPLAVHVDGESCMCQQDITLRCIPKRVRMIGS